MRAVIYSACLLLFIQVSSFAQQSIPSNNLLLGYQKFPTTITGHAADSSGNQYFVGTFKGELTINSKVIAQGNGLEDVFWVKLDSGNRIVKFNTYGSEQSDQSFYDGLVMADSNCMLFGARTFDPLTFGSFTVTPYTTSIGNSLTGCLVYADTSGTVKWVRKTNLQNFKLYYGNGIFHVIASTPASSSSIKVENTVVVDSTGLPSIVDLMFDQTGRLLNAKTITSRKKDQSLSLSSVSSFGDKKLLLGVSCYGDTSFTIGSQAVALPGKLASYNLFIRTDTGYTSVKTKILNPLGYSIYFNGISSYPMTVSRDSIYAIITFESQAPFTSLDGFSQAAQRNVLYVFDSSLTARRQVLLSSSLAGTYPLAPQRRRLFFRNIALKGQKLYFMGQFTGINESPWNSMVVKDTTLTVLPDVKLTVNLNGPSQSFIARCNLNGYNGIGKWYGDHHEYETIFLKETFFHDAGPKGLAFVHMQDNVWNSWLVDTSLRIVTGAMQKNTDMPEVTQMIKYFDDGSRIVIGYAKGKTALDSTGDFTTNASRQDLFLARLRSNNQVVWYKRFQSTLVSASVRGLEVKDGKAWFLINYVGTQNDSNFVKVDNNVFDVKVNASVLANIDTAGNLTILSFSDPKIRYAFLTSFSFFANGDVAALATGSFVSLPGFPTSVVSPYLFRLKPTNGSLLDARKIVGPSGVDCIRVDNNDQIYISGSIGSTVPYRLYLHDGMKYIDSLSEPSTTAALGLVKLDWNHLKWQKHFSIAFLSNAELVLINNKPVLLSPANPNQPLSWDGQAIHNGFSTLSLSIVGLDTNGVMTRTKVLPAFFYSYSRAGTNGNLYLCGTVSQALKIDTIQISNAGGPDGLGIVLDTNLTARRSFRIASSYSESLLDMDIFRDSVVALAYIAQTNPQVYTNRVMTKTSDYEQDAYIGTFTSRVDVVTAVNKPLPLFNEVSISPNPVQGNQLNVSCTVSQSLPSTCRIYQSSGQFMTSKALYLTPGTKQYSVTLPATISNGVYYILISNKKWTTIRSFIKQ